MNKIIKISYFIVILGLILSCTDTGKKDYEITEAWISMPDDIRLAADIYWPADYKKEKISGYNFVKKYGGKVIIIKRIRNYSTTSIIKKN